jgi:hypothetical protein
MTQKPRIFEPVKRSKRVRTLIKRMGVDPLFDALVHAIADVVKKYKAKPHTARAASDVVIQRMRERQYGESIREEPKKDCDGGCDCDGSCEGHETSE